MTTDLNPHTSNPQRTLTLIIYALYAASCLLGITAIVAIVLNYVKRAEVADTLYATHFTWQIRTFWLGLGGMVLAVLTMKLLVGWALAVITAVWAIYRLVVGVMKLLDGQPVIEGRYGLAA